MFFLQTFSQKYECKHKIGASVLTEITGFKKTLQSKYVATKVIAFPVWLMIVPIYSLYLPKLGGLYIAYIWIHICECCMSYSKPNYTQYFGQVKENFYRKLFVLTKSAVAKQKYPELHQRLTVPRNGFNSYVNVTVLQTNPSRKGLQESSYLATYSKEGQN